MSKWTQRGRAEAMLLALFESGENVITTQLERLLEQAQNAPPHGAADGSIGEEQYNALRDLVIAMRHVEVCGAKVVRAFAEQADAPGPRRRRKASAAHRRALEANVLPCDDAGCPDPECREIQAEHCEPPAAPESQTVRTTRRRVR